MCTIAQFSVHTAGVVSVEASERYKFKPSVDGTKMLMILLMGGDDMRRFSPFFDKEN